MGWVDWVIGRVSFSSVQAEIMVFGPILNKLNVLLQGENILSVIECHEEHNFICIQIDLALQWVKVRVSHLSEHLGTHPCSNGSL